MARCGSGRDRAEITKTRTELERDIARDEGDPETAVLTAFEKLIQAKKALIRANQSAEDRVRQSCPDLRGEAFHRQVRKDEALQAAYDTLIRAIEEMYPVFRRRDVRQWEKVNVSANVLKRFRQALQRVADRTQRELQRRTLSNSGRAASPTKDKKVGL